MHHFNDLWQLVASCGNLVAIDKILIINIVAMWQVKTLFIMCKKKINKIFMQKYCGNTYTKKKLFYKYYRPHFACHIATSDNQ